MSVKIIRSFLFIDFCRPERSEGSRWEILRFAQNDRRAGPGEFSSEETWGYPTSPLRSSRFAEASRDWPSFAGLAAEGAELWEVGYPPDWLSLDEARDTLGQPGLL